MPCGSFLRSYNFIGMTIDNGRLRFVELLGEGAYGMVYRAVDESSAASSSSPGPTSYAVKVLEKALPESRRWRFQQREVAAHLSVEDHPNIVSIHGLHECDSFVYIVLEYCVGGDLLDAMLDRFMFCNNDALVKSAFTQLLDAVEYCHESGVFHRDLKPDNILVNLDGSQIKLADFGLATTAQVSDTYGCGSSYYMSPECIGDGDEFHPYSTEASDVWSLGVVLTNLVAGRNPWTFATRRDKCYSSYLDDPTYLRQMLPISEETSDILQAIFTDPVSRISIPELRKRILAVETFFMSAEEIAHGNKFLKMAAASYRAPDDDACDQSVFCDNDAWQLWGQTTSREAAAICAMVCSSPVAFGMKMDKGKRPHTVPEPRFVIAPTEGVSKWSSSESSSGDSQEPITPETYAQDHVQLEEIPDFSESEKIGEAYSPVARKGWSLPARSIAVAAPV